MSVGQEAYLKPRTATACGSRARAAKIPEGFSNESPKKFVWRPAHNCQLKCKGTCLKFKLWHDKISRAASILLDEREVSV